MAAAHPDLPSFSVFLEGHQGGHRQHSERQRFAPTEISVRSGRAVPLVALKEPAMIGARAPGAACALVLEIGAPAWSFFVFSLLDCAPMGSGRGNRQLFSSRISWQALWLRRSTAARPKFSSFAEYRQSSQQRERRWQRLAATSDSLHTGLIVARLRFFRLCGTVTKGPATGQLLATACGTRDSLPIGQAMTGSRIFRVCGKAAGRVAIRRWLPGFARAGEGWRR